MRYLEPGRESAMFELRSSSDRALRELRRVMRPGTLFHFADHGHASDAKVARMQDRFDGLQQKVAGGCHLNRAIDALLVDAGFEIDAIRNSYLKGPRALGYMYVGRARNP